MSDAIKTYCVRFVDQRFMSISINARNPEHAEAIAEWIWTEDRQHHRFYELEREPFEAAFTEEVMS